MSHPANASTAAAVTEPQLITHHIGEVTCILMVPAGCPVPHVALTVYAHRTTVDEREAAVDMFDLTADDECQRNGLTWREREAGPYRATVFLGES